MDQALQIAGAILILLAFFALQRRWLTPEAPAYVSLNLAGSSILTVIAAADDDWGFLLLQGTWAIVSAWALLQMLRGSGGRRRR